MPAKKTDGMTDAELEAAKAEAKAERKRKDDEAAKLAEEAENAKTALEQAIEDEIDEIEAEGKLTEARREAVERTLRHLASKGQFPQVGPRASNYGTPEEMAERAVGAMKKCGIPLVGMHEVKAGKILRGLLKESR